GWGVARARAGVPGPVQPGVAVRTSPASNARAGARPTHGASGVSQFRANPDEREGRRGSRIDSEEGGRYLGIPPQHSQRTHRSVTINPVSSESGAVQTGPASRVASGTGLTDSYTLPVGASLLRASCRASFRRGFAQSIDSALVIAALTSTGGRSLAFSANRVDLKPRALDVESF